MSALSNCRCPRAGGAPRWIMLLGWICGYLVVTEAGAQCQRAELSDPATHQWDNFGLAVSATGDTVFVGAPFDDEAEYNRGAVYVVERHPEGWQLAQKLLHPISGGMFGRSICVDGQTAVIGAKSDWPCVFDWTGAEWDSAALLIPDEADGNIGLSVALEGTTALIGAPDDDWYEGSVHVFELVDAQWAYTQELHPLDLGIKMFGYSVDIDGQRAVIGAPDDDDQGSYSGSAYVFERGSDGKWSQMAKLLASDGKPLVGYANAVAISGDVVLVGAADAYGAAAYSGVVYAYERRRDGVFVETARLYPPDGTSGQNFGRAVAMDGDVAIVGDTNGGGLGGFVGAAYVLVHRADGSWSWAGKLEPADGLTGDRFGWAVALGGTTAVIGAPYKDAGGPYGEDCGAAYIFAVGPDEDGDGVMDACETPGDLNCDGAIDAFDIDPFILALTDPVSYAWKYPTCGIINADCNGDGTVDAFDIDPFVALLIE